MGVWLISARSTATRALPLFPSCLGSRNRFTSARAASDEDWVHEIKHDGYRLIVRRDGGALA